MRFAHVPSVHTRPAEELAAGLRRRRVPAARTCCVHAQSRAPHCRPDPCVRYFCMHSPACAFAYLHVWTFSDSSPPARHPDKRPGSGPVARDDARSHAALARDPFRARSTTRPRSHHRVVAIPVLSRLPAHPSWASQAKRRKLIRHAHWKPPPSRNMRTWRSGTGSFALQAMPPSPAGHAHLFAPRRQHVITLPHPLSRYGRMAKSQELAQAAPERTFPERVTWHASIAMHTLATRLPRLIPRPGATMLVAPVPGETCSPSDPSIHRQCCTMTQPRPTDGPEHS
jgi:hypothetical protein